MREWNAESCHAVSGPQFGWGQQVLATIALSGTESADIETSLVPASVVQPTPRHTPPF